jgi:hypothetical protein
VTPVVTCPAELRLDPAVYRASPLTPPTDSPQFPGERLRRSLEYVDPHVDSGADERTLPRLGYRCAGVTPLVNLILIRTVASIGVYGWTLETFLEALARARVTLVVDVRQRRAVRGREYPWANSLRLQHLLSDAGLGYLHLKALAPTTELRQLQYAEDARHGVGKRSRVQLAPAYRERYTREILDRGDLDQLVLQLPIATRATLLCVEREPAACHRSLISERLRDDYNCNVIDLVP